MPIATQELANHQALASDEAIRLEPRDFDARYIRSSSSVTLAVDSLRGRCGDVIVVQLKSSANALQAHKDTLRSLGLGRPNAASLRWGKDGVTQGYIHAVRHLVGVVFLLEPCYKEGISPLFESQQYGTRTRPGEILRSFDGEYIGYRSERDAASIYMSTEASFSDVLVGLQRCGMETELSSPDTWVSIQSPAGEWDSRRGRYERVVDGLDLAWIRRSTLPVRTLGRATRESVSLMIMWQQDIQRFHDMTRRSNELGVIAVGDAIRSVALLKETFAEARVREDAALRVNIATKGRRVEIVV